MLVTPLVIAVDIKSKVGGEKHAFKYILEAESTAFSQTECEKIKVKHKIMMG